MERQDHEYADHLDRGTGTLYRKGRAKQPSYDGHAVTSFEVNPLGLHISGQPPGEGGAMRSQGRLQQQIQSKVSSEMANSGSSLHQANRVPPFRVQVEPAFKLPEATVNRVVLAPRSGAASDGFDLKLSSARGGAASSDP